MNREIKERTKWFMDARFGMFIHWGLYSIPACGEWVMSQKEMTIEEYRKYFEQFDPVDYDPKTEQYLRFTPQEYVLQKKRE